MTDEVAPPIDPERRARGLDWYRKVYGEGAIEIPEGHSAFFDQMLVQLFGEVWGRGVLSIEMRRLLVIGVLAAQGRWEQLALQFRRSLDAGELTPEQLREAVIHLIQYVGYPSATDLYRLSETAIHEHKAAQRSAEAQP